MMLPMITATTTKTNEPTNNNHGIYLVAVTSYKHHPLPLQTPPSPFWHGGRQAADRPTNWWSSIKQIPPKKRKQKKEKISPRAASTPPPSVRAQRRCIDTAVVHHDDQIYKFHPHRADYSTTTHLGTSKRPPRY